MLKLIIYILVGLFVLSFFGVSVQHIIESPTTQANFDYVETLLAQGWEDIVNLVPGVWNGGANAIK